MTSPHALIRMVMRAFLILLFISTSPLKAENLSILKREAFAIANPAQKADWAYFMKATPGWRKELWFYFAKQGKALVDWSWSWRAGWIRTCSEMDEEWCESILKVGLKDSAMVVRAEAAKSFGKFYGKFGAGSKSSQAVQDLKMAFAHEGNVRNGKPLFVQDHILLALWQIGGDEAIMMGHKLALKYDQTKQYWKKLQGKG